MKRSELIEQINRDVGGNYNTSDIGDWINRALDDLTPITKKEAKTTFTIDNNNSYTLPTDLHEIAYLFIDKKKYKPLHQENFDSTGYKVWSDQLELQNGPDNGTIDLFYFKKLKHLVNPEDIPEVEEEYHDLLILYSIGQIQFEDEDYDDRPDILNRYYQRKQEYERYIKRKRRTGRVRQV